MGMTRPKKAEIRACLAHVIETCLRLSHPFLPFITEDIWQQTSLLGDQKRGWLATAPWPEAHHGIHANDHVMVGRAIEMIEAVRSTRVELGIKPWCHWCLRAWF
jgi:Valyl-tRNA synthetase